MRLSAIYDKLSLLSIDVSLGAVAGGIMALNVLGYEPPRAYWLVLPIAVWIIYTADHIIDGLKNEGTPSHKRHRFHRDNLRLLTMAAIPLGLSGAYLAFAFLPQGMVVFGLILGGLVIAYLGLILLFRRKAPPILQKELFVAIFYTAGIWGPVAVMKSSIDGYDWLLIVIFGMLALTDLFLLSVIDLSKDQLDGEASFPTRYGSGAAGRMFQVISILALSGSAFVMLTAPADGQKHAAALLAVMDILLIFIFKLASTTGKKQVYRYLSELVFFVPALILLW